MAVEDGQRDARADAHPPVERRGEGYGADGRGERVEATLALRRRHMRGGDEKAADATDENSERRPTQTTINFGVTGTINQIYPHPSR